MTSPPQTGSQRIGRYVLLGRLGQGGMGEVHRARAFGAAGVTKELCIKRIRRSRLAEASAPSRFVQEARLWMQLSHANIVQVFDFGRIENDYYLAMEWVDGCDLRALLEDAAARGAPFAEEEALYLASELARALSYLHDAGGGRAVAHCDLKPGNVLVSKKSEVKLADFGVAVAAESARAGGTRGYIPPSEAERVGTGADLYALGRVLTELSDRAEPGAGTELLRAIADDLLSPSPSRGAARSIEAELESALASARVRSGRSPRELLATRVAAVPVGERAEHESMETDASFLAAEDEASFLQRMEAASERSTASRSTPAPTPEKPPARRAPLGALGLVALGIVAVSLGVAGLARGPEAPAREPAIEVAERPTVSAPAEPAPTSVGAPTPAPPALDPAASERPRPAPPVERPREERPARPALLEVPAPEPAVLRVNARPWAEVEIDGVARGATPLRSVELSPGPHVVRLSNPATGRDETVAITLAPGERRDVISDLR